MKARLPPPLRHDPHLPHRDRLLQDSLVSEWLSRHLSSNGPVQFDSVERARVKYRIGESLRIVYRLRAGAVESTVAARMFRPGRSGRVFREASRTAADVGPFRGVSHAPDLDTVFWTFPNDRKIADLALLPRVLGGSASHRTLILEAVEGACVSRLPSRHQEAGFERLGTALASMHALPPPAARFARLTPRRLRQAALLISQVRPDVSPSHEERLARAFLAGYGKVHELPPPIPFAGTRPLPSWPSARYGPSTGSGRTASLVLRICWPALERSSRREAMPETAYARFRRPLAALADDAWIMARLSDPHEVVGWIRLRPFTADEGLPTLPAVLSRPGRRRVIRYRPHRQCTIRFEGEGHGLFAKVFPDERGERVHAEAVALWEASAHGELAFRVARPVRWDRAERTLWHEELPGEPVVDRLRSGQGPELAERMGRALASLSQSRLAPAGLFDGDAQLRHTSRGGEELCRHVPRLRPIVTAILHKLSHLHRQTAARRPRPIHGAPHAHQWLDDGGQLGLLDFDRISRLEKALKTLRTVRSDGDLRAERRCRYAAALLEGAQA
jgi:hypothetical protein